MSGLPLRKESYGGTVEPVKRRRTRGTLYEDEYRYGEVHMDFDPDDIFPDDAQYHKKGNVLFYRYGMKPPVMVDDDGVHVHEEWSEEDTQRQAYFVLSMLDADGYVSNWSKK